MINGAGEQRETAAGYALLLSATQARGALVDVGGVLPALAAVPPPALLGTPTGSVVQMVDPPDPHTVLAALRTAAGHDGPLLLVVGQLLPERRGGSPHVALARSTERSTSTQA